MSAEKGPEAAEAKEQLIVKSRLAGSVTDQIVVNPDAQAKEQIVVKAQLANTATAETDVVAKQQIIIKDRLANEAKDNPESAPIPKARTAGSAG